MIEENDKTSLLPQKIDENTASNISLTGRIKKILFAQPPPLPSPDNIICSSSTFSRVIRIQEIISQLYYHLDSEIAGAITPRIGLTNPTSSENGLSGDENFLAS